MTWTAQPGTARFDTPVGTVPCRSVRLTRRGRVVLVLAMLTVAFVAFTVGRAGASHAATERGVTTPYSLTTVHTGETLWSVATRVAPGRDPRVVVERIRELNHLDTASLQAGQQLLLPHVA